MGAKSTLETSPGKVWLVGAGPGEPDLVTLRGRRLLGEADVVLHDALSHPGLLAFCPQAEVVDVGKRYGERATAQASITRLLLELAQQGKKVVRLKGGDPLLFARGAEEALALAAAKIPFEIVPGVTSPMAAAAFAGISLTHRDLSSSVTFITGSDRDGKDWSPDAWKKLATATGTICVVMGMRRIFEITRAIIEGGRDPSTPAAVVQWGARPEQRTVVGSLATIAEQVGQAGLKSPAIIIVGEVVALRTELDWYESKPLFGRRILVPRPEAQAIATADAIRCRGARALVHPAIEITPPPDLVELERALLAMHAYDWVVFTSANGVGSAFDVLGRLGKDARAFGSSNVAAIGPRTAARLRRHGVSPDLEPAEFVAESLVEALLRELGSEKALRARGDEKRPRVLLVRAAEARDVLPNGLRAQGVEVDVVAAYVTRPVTGPGRAELTAGVESADVIFVTSSSMVDSLASALGGELQSALEGKTLLSIGPITSATARSHGLDVSVEAKVFTVEGALDALEEYFLRADGT